MTDFTNATSINAVRKPRRCYWCEDRIEQGTPAVRVVGVWEGNFSVIYLHPDCEEAWKRDPCNQNEEGCHYEHERGRTCAEAQSEPPVRQRW